MKKIILTFILGFTSLISLQAQTIDELKKGNTFFILFEEGDFAKKKNIISPEKPIKYQFYRNKKDGLDKTPYDFAFYYADYFDNRKASMGTAQTKIFRVHKSFLKKNKKIILSKAEIDAFGEYNMINLFKNTKRNLFLIDKSEIKDNQILIRGVVLMSVAYE